MAATMIGYMKGNQVTDWHGTTVLATITRKTVRKAPYTQYISNERVWFDAVGTEGTRYYGRGFGDGVNCYLYQCKGA